MKYRNSYDCSHFTDKETETQKDEVTCSSSHSLVAEQVLGCIPQAYEACTCPVLRPKKDPGVSNRDISGLMDRGKLTRLKQHPTVCGDGGQDTVAVLTPGGKKRLPILRGNYVRLAH